MGKARDLYYSIIARENLASVLFAAGIFTVYFLLSLTYSTGPAYLSDEIGYVTKAAAISGSTIDAASSWHAGYSFLISPAFWLPDTHAEWIGILFLNAAMFAVSGYVLLRIFREYFPSEKFNLLLGVGALSFLYPAYISMTGYAFSTPGFVLFFMLSLFFLLKSDLRINWWLLGFAAASGYLYWIHPMGIVPVGLAILLIGWVGFTNRKLRLAGLFIALIITIVATYQFTIQSWLRDIMTPDGLAAVTSHYSSVVPNFIHKITTVKFWEELTISLAGQVFYLTVATFGGVLLFVKYVISRLRYSWRDRRSIVVTYVLASVVGSVLLSAVMFAGGDIAHRADIWVYGRYVEPVLLLPIAFGFYSIVTGGYGRKRTLIILVVIAVTGGYLTLMTNVGNTNFGDYNQVNVQALWPAVAFFAVNFSFLLITILAALATAVLGLFEWGALQMTIPLTHLRPRWIVVLGIAFLMILATAGQVYYHWSILSRYSEPSEQLIAYIEDNFQKGSCVGVQEDLLSVSERPRLYSYYLHDYRIQRMNPNVWQSDCNGPYLVVSPDGVGGEAQIVGREVLHDFYLAVKQGSVAEKSKDYIDAYFYTNPDDERCVIDGCFEWTADDKGKFFYEKSITSRTPRGIQIRGAGQVLVGPLSRVRAGLYKLSIRGDVNSSSLTILVHSGLVGDSIARGEMSESGVYTIPVQVPIDMKDFTLEVIGKDATTQAIITSISLTKD